MKLKISSTAGNVMVEMALVLPFFLALVFFGIEASRIMQSSEITIGLSRELAVAGMHCLPKLPEDLNQPPEMIYLDECMKKAVRDFRDRSAMFPSLQVVLTYYRSDGTANSVDGPYRQGDIGKSRFDLQAVTLDKYRVKDALINHRRIIIAEVVTPLRTILPYMPGISAELNSNEMYAYAVL